MQEKVIHYEKFYRPLDMILISMAAIVFGFLVILAAESWIPLIVYVLFIIAIFLIAASLAKTYVVYEARIEIIHPITKKVKQRIFFEELESVRYEDDFTHRDTWTDYMMYYPKSGPHKVKGIRLLVRGFYRDDYIFKLLKFYQSKDIKIFIKTRSEEWLEELGLKNWDEP